MNRIGRAFLKISHQGLVDRTSYCAKHLHRRWCCYYSRQLAEHQQYSGVDPNTGASRNIPGLGLVLVISLILVAGIFVTNFVTEPMYNWF